MHPIDFDEVNVVVAKDQTPYKPLPVCVMHDGVMVACWKMSLRERLKVLFTGKIWYMLMTFGQPVQPHKLEVNKPDMTTVGMAAPMVQPDKVDKA